MESAINMFDGILYNSSILGDMDGAMLASFKFTFCTKEDSHGTWDSSCD